VTPNLHLANALTLIRKGYCLGANAKDTKGIACGVLDPPRTASFNFRRPIRLGGHFPLKSVKCKRPDPRCQARAGT
jgi:hypothetical protein